MRAHCKYVDFMVMSFLPSSGTTRLKIRFNCYQPFYLYSSGARHENVRDYTVAKPPCALKKNKLYPTYAFSKQSKVLNPFGKLPFFWQEFKVLEIFSFWASVSRPLKTSVSIETLLFCETIWSEQWMPRVFNHRTRSAVETYCANYGRIQT